MVRVSLDPPASFFKRPFGAEPGQPTPEPAAESAETKASSRGPSSLAAQLSQEWEELENRIRGSGGGDTDISSWHAEVGSFLRRWGVAVAALPHDRQGSLASLLESARASLLALLSLSASRENTSAQARLWQQAEDRQRKALEQAEHERRMEAGRAEVRRLQEETQRIQAETSRSTRLSQERNQQLARAALFPENHCPYCSRSYLDLSGGCWHCQHWHRPGHF